MKRFSLFFTLVELLALMGIIGILAAILLPALNRSREKGKQSQCINQLKQISLGMEMYRNEFRGSFPYWISNLYSSYINTKQVYQCPNDSVNKGKPAAEWIAHPQKLYPETYDRPKEGKQGAHQSQPSPVDGVSYFYEMNDAICNWSLSSANPNHPVAPYTWAELKEFQLKFENGGEGYDPTLFPVVRCFWHFQKGKNLGENARPVLNISYAGNYFMSPFKWEAGAWTP